MGHTVFTISAIFSLEMQISVARELGHCEK